MGGSQTPILAHFAFQLAHCASACCWLHAVYLGGWILFPLRVIGFSHSSGYPLENIDTTVATLRRFHEEKREFVSSNQRLSFTFESIIVNFMIKSRNLRICVSKSSRFYRFLEKLNACMKFLCSAVSVQIRVCNVYLACHRHTQLGWNDNRQLAQHPPVTSVRDPSVGTRSAWRVRFREPYPPGTISPVTPARVPARRILQSVPETPTYTLELAPGPRIFTLELAPDGAPHFPLCRGT